MTIRIPADRALVGYIAGLFDGEGHLSHMTVRADGTRACWRLTISNTNREVMDWLTATVGGSVVAQRQADARWRALFTWRVGTNPDLRVLLRAILPYLIVKRATAERALSDIESFLARYEEPAVAS